MTKTTKNKQKPHKYRVSVYLGKELYETLNGMANFMQLPLATATRILLETGVQVGTAIDKKNTKELRKYGKSKV